MELPSHLQTAIAGELGSVSAKGLAKSVTDLSQRYRTGNGQPSGGRFLHTPADIAAYAAFRLPATFAAVYAALTQLQERQPHWQPRRLLDVGAGPGTATWAASTVWPHLERATLLEREDGMIALGRRLAAHSPAAAGRAADWRKADVTGDWEATPHDLVIASYVIGELSEERCTRLIRKLWDATSGALLLIEPGSQAGFARVRAAREQLVAQGAKVVAPCPHDGPCPMSGSDWCHFSQRVARSRLHRQVKAGELSYEDEKFAFVALSRQPGLPLHGRVIRHPQVRSGHIHFQLCTGEGLKSEVVTRKDRERFREAREQKWGSPWQRMATDRLGNEALAEASDEGPPATDRLLDGGQGEG